MKYYIISLNNKEVHTPIVTNWYKDISISSFFQGRTWNIPFRNLLYVKDCGWEPRYLKLLFSPFPLIHESLISAFHEYGIQCVQKQMIFLDLANNKSELYYLSLLMQFEAKIMREQGKAYIRCSDRKLKDCEAFYILDERNISMVCSLALTESLLREGLTGILLEPVEIRREESSWEKN